MFIRGFLFLKIHPLIMHSGVCSPYGEPGDSGFWASIVASESSPSRVLELDASLSSQLFPYTMFSKNDQKTFVDLSAELNDELDWKAGDLRTFEHHLFVSAVAIEPISGFLAIGKLSQYTCSDPHRLMRIALGTTKGIVEIYGSPGVEQRLTLADRYRIRFLAFTSSPFKILCIGSKR